MPCGSPCCPRCGLPYTGAAGSDHLCDECVCAPPPFEAARAAFLYGGAVHDMVTSFKYAKRIHAGETLTRMALETGAPALAAVGCDLAVPVPLHFTRLFSRGFNQSAVIARMVAHACNLRYGPSVLRRGTKTPAQAGLKRRDREVNLKGAFTAARPRDLRGRTVLLVDDVFTTGATAAECARTLLAADAAAVSVFTLARTA